MSKVAQLNFIGIVPVSLGSIVDTRQMPNELAFAFLDAFAQFPNQLFVWKFATEDELVKRRIAALPNVYATEWFQQKEVLSTFY